MPFGAFFFVKVGTHFCAQQGTLPLPPPFATHLGNKCTRVPNYPPPFKLPPLFSNCTSLLIMFTFKKFFELFKGI